MTKGAMDISGESKQSLYENTVKWIEQLVLSGNYKTGEKLPSEREMCESEGVSRTVLREALRSVESKGLITIFAGKGVYVRNPDLETVTEPLQRLFDAAQVDFYDLMQARHFLEPSIAYLAALKINDEHLEKLKSDHEMMKSSQSDSNLFIVADQNFHFDLAIVTGNPVLIIMVQTLTNGLVILREIAEKPGAAGKIIMRHENILNALMQRNATAAYQAMEEHLLDVEEQHRSILVQSSLEKRHIVKKKGGYYGQIQQE